MPPRPPLYFFVAHHLAVATEPHPIDAGGKELRRILPCKVLVPERDGTAESVLNVPPPVKCYFIFLYEPPAAHYFKPNSASIGNASLMVAVISG